MSINLPQLASSLNESVTCVLLTGDEPLQLIESQDHVRASAKQWGYLERSVYEVSRGFDFNELTQAADNLSLFADKKLVELRFDKLPDKVQQQALVALFSQPQEDTFWLISCPKMDKRKLATKWVKAIDSVSGLVVQIWPIQKQNLGRWLSERAKKLGIKLAPDALQMLAERSEGNLLAAKQDLDKLALLNDENVISLPTVLETVANNARYNVFELIDSALSGEHQKVTKMLGQLRLEAVPVVVIVANVYRECRQLAKMSQQVANGQSQSEVFREYRVWSSRSQILGAALTKLPPKVWLALVSRCAHLDKLAKGMAQGNAWDELLTCLLLMGGQRLWRKAV